MYEYSNKKIKDVSHVFVDNRKEIKQFNAYGISQISSFVDQSAMQRRVGMEFQTVGGNWNIKKIKKNSDGKLECVAPEHGEELYKVGGLSVQADFTDLEYVTDSFDERNEIPSLVDTVNRASAKHCEYTSGDKYLIMKYDDYSFVKYIDKIKDVSAGEDDCWIINPKGEKTAHPQATIGIKLESIDTFINNIATKPYGRLSSEPLLDTPKLFLDKLFARQTVRKVNKIVASKTMLGPIQKGFINLILQNIHMIKTFMEKSCIKKLKGLTNAKNSMVFMSRTSLDNIYNQLRPEAKLLVISTLQSTPEYSDDKAYIAYQTGGPCILFKDWLNELKSNNSDMLINKYHSVSEISPSIFTSSDEESEKIKRKFNITRPTDIGYDETIRGTDGRADEIKQIHGALIELRALTRNVATKDWPVIARNVANLVNEVNNPVTNPKK